MRRLPADPDTRLEPPALQRSWTGCPVAGRPTAPRAAQARPTRPTSSPPPSPARQVAVRHRGGCSPAAEPSYLLVHRSQGRKIAATSVGTERKRRAEYLKAFVARERSALGNFATDHGR